MLRSLIFLYSSLIISILSDLGNQPCAKDVIFQSQTALQFNTDTKTYEQETKITFTIGMGETVCFSVKSDSGLEQDYSLSFNDVSSIYTYKNGYTFALGEPHIKCLCDCPGLENHCGPGRDSCSVDGVFGDNCFKYYSSNQPSKGCGLLAFAGPGEVCCSVNIKTVSDTHYKAFQISPPVNRAQFTFNDDTGSRKFATDLSSGSSIFLGDMRIAFESPGNVNPISSGFYFGKVNTDEVLTNVEVNGLADWDLNKLGWYKYQNSRYQLNEYMVKQAITGEVVDCDSSDIQLSFGSKFIGNNLEDAKPLAEFYTATISKAVRSDTDRNVIVSYRRFSRLSVMISFSGKLTVTHEYSEPKFQDFFGVALLDKYSNRFLNVTIINGKGTLTGTMNVGNEARAYFDFTIPSSDEEVRNYTRYVQITQWCDEDLVASLCIHDGDVSHQVCKQIFCNEEPLTEFEIPEAGVNYTRIHKDNFLSLGTWMKYINPLEWFNGVSSWQEGLIMVISLLILVALLGLLYKVVKFLNCLAKCFACCNCLRSSGQEERILDKQYRRHSNHDNTDLRKRLSTMGEEIMELWRKRNKYKKLVASGRISEHQYAAVLDALDDIERTISPSSSLKSGCSLERPECYSTEPGFQRYIRRVEKLRGGETQSDSCPILHAPWLSESSNSHKYLKHSGSFSLPQNSSSLPGSIRVGRRPRRESEPDNRHATVSRDGSLTSRKRPTHSRDNSLTSNSMSPLCLSQTPGDNAVFVSRDNSLPNHITGLMSRDNSLPNHITGFDSRDFGPKRSKSNRQRTRRVSIGARSHQGYEPNRAFDLELLEMLQTRTRTRHHSSPLAAEV